MTTLELLLMTNLVIFVLEIAIPPSRRVIFESLEALGWAWPGQPLLFLVGMYLQYLLYEISPYLWILCILLSMGYTVLRIVLRPKMTAEAV